MSENDRVCLFLMDYAHKRRIKIWGRARVEHDPAVIEKLMPSGYRARPEQAMIITIEAWDGNCPQHIPHLVPYEELEKTREALQRRIANSKPNWPNFAPKIPRPKTRAFSI